MTDALPSPTPLTDLRRRVNLARRTIRQVLDETLGPAVGLRCDFHREWNGCWKVQVELRDGERALGRLDFTLLDTPDGGLLALPRPLPESWRLAIGIPASDGSRWTLDDSGALRPWPPRGQPVP